MLLQRLKTGQLFEFSCEAGAILAEASDADRERMRHYARDMGLVFQITDDLLDVTSTAEKTGKAVGKDQDQGKATLVSIYGVNGARAEAERLARRAAETLSSYRCRQRPVAPVSNVFAGSGFLRVATKTCGNCFMMGIELL